ncbi:ABC transporter substrate-binding protein [Microbacterium sp. 22303]|uniref:ABC transporter substrate-binding protein n=1 Tax=Microbacterium sp. 22303 TaxID=3453905 RepID=UPI003F85916E
MNRSIPALAVATITAAVLFTSCSPKVDAPAPADTGDVVTGAGVSGGEITLGMLVDLSGPFAAIGKELSQAAQVYWDQRNADGGVCGQFTVSLDVKDNAYNVQNTVSLYTEMSPDVLAFQNILGSAPTTALADSLAADDMLVVTHGQGQELLGDEHILITGATFDLEALNGLGYLQEQGLISDGGTIGHIYLEGAYGEGVLEGVNEYADAHDTTVVPIQITPAITDLTGAVADLQSRDVQAIVISGSPPQLASAAAAAEAAGLDVPLLGSTPTWTAGLLDTPAGDALREHLYVAFPAAPFENEDAAAFRDAYLAAYPDENPSLQIVLEYSEALALDAVLEKACENGDLTRAGVLGARSEISTLQTGVTPELDLSDPAKAATAEEYLTRAADEPGGLVIVDGPYASSDAQEAYAAR